MDVQQEIECLRAELEQANYEYYIQDAPTMSDYDFDHKLRRLEELEAAHPELVTADSPTQRVGGKVAEGFAEVVHQVPLESLQDVFSFEELKKLRFPIPNIKIQKNIVNIYNTYILRKEINEKLKEQLKKICPILIKGAIEESKLS